MAKLSVVLATFNEEKNIGSCLESVKDIADEMVIVDGSSTDRTVEIANQFGAKVTVTENHPIFHINKQKALDLATHEWILQLDADEVVSAELAKEISQVINMNTKEVYNHQATLKNKRLFSRHTHLIEERDGRVGRDTPDFVAFFIPRKNYFLGRYLMHGGVYPDGVIRLIHKGRAHFPAKSVHEQMVIEGRVGWLQNDLIHMDSPTFSKYLMRWNRYTNLISKEIKEETQGKNVIQRVFIGIGFLFLRPAHWFLTTYFRHKGFLDSWQGFLFSFFSALRFPVSYGKYLLKSA